MSLTPGDDSGNVEGGGTLVIAPRQSTSGESFPLPTDGATSPTNAFTIENKHLWYPTMVCGTILVVGNLVVRKFGGAPALRRRRHALVGAMAVYTSSLDYLRLSMKHQIRTNDQTSYLWWAVVGTTHFRGRGLETKLEEMRRLVSTVFDEQGMFKYHLLERHYLKTARKKGLMHWLWERSRFSWTTPQERIASWSEILPTCRAFGVSVNDSILLAAQIALLTKPAVDERTYGWTQHGLVAAFMVAHGAYGPVLLGLAGVVGVYSLACQVKPILQDLYMLHHLSAYEDARKLSAALHARRVFDYLGDSSGSTPH